MHIDDVAGALWTCAKWMDTNGYAEAYALAGEEILFKNDKGKVAEVEGMVAPDVKCIAPLFNLVSYFAAITADVLTVFQEDDTQTTMADLGKIVTSFFGTTFEYHSFLMNAMAKVRRALPPSIAYLMCACSSSLKISWKKSMKFTLINGQR